jgi:hypothetical protein
MTKERLSKLQKWILNRCLINIRIQRHEIRGFFGKVFYPIPGKKVYMRPKDAEKRFGKQNARPEDFEVIQDGIDFFMYPKLDLRSTLSIEASISRSLRNLHKKGLIQMAKWITLTERGFLLLIKDKNNQFINFNEYATKVKEIEIKEQAKGIDFRTFKKMAKVFGEDFPDLKQ